VSKRETGKKWIAVMKLVCPSTMFFLGALLLPALPLHGGQQSLQTASPASAKSQAAVFPLSPEDAKQIVLQHNQVRAQVGVPPVRWSRQLADYAQQWADHLAATRCGLQHRPRSGQWRQEYGENLFMGTIGYYGIVDAVKEWADEKKLYPGGPYQASWRGIGHYTQIVWRDTRQIGCATSVCQGNLVVVCNYDPPGNYIGQSPY
jgi:pathogenesis-related protein 1